ncbi:MAG: hypothetical protein ACOC35_09410 [Promethearchaeia archaeon]
MTVSEIKKSKLNPLNLFRKQINPDFIEFIHQKISEVKNIFSTLKNSIKETEFRDTFPLK